LPSLVNGWTNNKKMAMVKHKPNLLHVLRDFSPVAGGVPRVVREIGQKDRFSSLNGYIFATKGVSELENVKICPESDLFPAWGWSLDQKSELKKSICTANLVHLHGIWSSVHYYSSLIANREKVPFLLTSHGMLEPWLWTQQGKFTYFKKKFYWNYLIRSKLANARVVHGITPLECDNLKLLFPKKEIICIPNAIDTKDLDDEYFYQEKQNEILFLGRIEPKKGVHILLEAFANAKIGSEWKLNIAGPVWDDSYMGSLRSYVKSNDLSERVSFLGMVIGDEKIKLLKKSWVMVTPSFSEVVGLVNLEAASHGLPSITTHETGLYNWTKGGGVLISPNPEDLQQSLEYVCSWSMKERLDRGFSSFKLVDEHYSWKVVGPQWECLYNDLIKRG
jgi:glycosyltransferase involved in cell wall biosynthesis